MKAAQDEAAEPAQPEQAKQPAQPEQAKQPAQPKDVQPGPPAGKGPDSKK